VGGERSIETVQHGKKLLNKIFDSAMPRLVALFLSSLAKIVEVRLQAYECVRQILFVRRKFLHLVGQRRLRRWSSSRTGIVVS
jgi:hypothetical protein